MTGVCISIFKILLAFESAVKGIWHTRYICGVFCIIFVKNYSFRAVLFQSLYFSIAICL